MQRRASPRRVWLTSLLSLPGFGCFPPQEVFFIFEFFEIGLIVQVERYGYFSQTIRVMHPLYIEFFIYPLKCANNCLGIQEPLPLFITKHSLWNGADSFGLFASSKCSVLVHGYTMLNLIINSIFQLQEKYTTADQESKTTDGVYESSTGLLDQVKVGRWTLTFSKQNKD